MNEEEKEIKEQKIFKSSFKLNEVIILILICLVIGVIIGYAINHEAYKNDKNLKKFVKTYDEILEDYYKDIEPDVLIEGAISGMLNKLDDPYSTYLDKEQSDAFNEQLEGNYKGVGIEISLNENLEIFITKVFDNTPASKAELKKDDVIISVNGTSVVGKNTSYVPELVKKSKNGKVTIVVKRDNKEITKELNLETITLDSVTSEIIDNNGKKTGYLKIDLFAANTYYQFNNKIVELENKGIDNLIIDVRNNSGGYLDVVTDISSLFVDKSKIIYQLEEKGKTTKIYSKTNDKREYKIVVLTNNFSASASEILTSSLKDSYGATIVGETTFGKGTVQETNELDNGGLIKYTTQKWLTPKGKWINEIGIEPNVKVELNDAYYEEPIKENDNQFLKALEVLSK